jgi:putative ABC transport system permease protein
MAHGKRFLYKLRNFLQPGRAERDLAREIGLHLELLQDEFRRRGMKDEDARLAAKRAYGGVEQAKELHREERSWPWLEQVRQDIRFSARTLLKSPGFSITAVLMLALGIGANTAIFSLINAVMLKTLPVSHPEQLLQVNMSNKDVWGTRSPFLSNPIWERLRDRQDVFSGIFADSVTRFNLAARGEARNLQGNYVSGQFFDTLGVRPFIGRTFSMADDERGCPATAVHSYGFWQREYGSRAEVLSKTIWLDNHPFEILGVAQPGFTGVDVGRESDLYAPLCAEKIVRGETSVLDKSGAGWLRVIGRAKEGIFADQIEVRLKALARPILDATVPPNLRPDQEEIYRKRTLTSQGAAHGGSNIRGQYRQALMGISGVVLLIACANIANLLLARGAAAGDWYSHGAWFGAWAHHTLLAYRESAAFSNRRGPRYFICTMGRAAAGGSACFERIPGEQSVSRSQHRFPHAGIHGRSGDSHRCLIRLGARMERNTGESASGYEGECARGDEGLEIRP